MDEKDWIKCNDFLCPYNIDGKCFEGQCKTLNYNMIHAFPIKE
jgi:hypothetical protein